MLTIGRVLNGVFDDEVGWRPATGAVKPVHVANGLFRALCSEYWDIEGVVEFVAWQKYGKPIPERSFEALGERRQDVFRAFSGNRARFERVRRYARGIVAADRAVFPDAAKSALTIACREMISRDDMDKGVGTFAAALLGDPGTGGSLAAAILRALTVETPQDPVTALVWPLISSHTRREWKPAVRTLALERRHATDTVAALRTAADCLANHELRQGNRLRTLQRGTLFTCLAIHSHAQGIAAGGEIRNRVPGLLAIVGGKNDSVAAVSERALDLMYSQFESWLATQLSKRLETGQSLDPHHRPAEPPLEVPTNLSQARRILDRILTAGREPRQPDDTVKAARQANLDYHIQQLGRDNLFNALASALVSSYVTEYESGGPRPFLQGLGRKSGLLYPPYQGRSREKRIRPTVAMLDVLVRATVQQGQIVPFDEFLQSLWRTFGLIVGVRRGEPSDEELLARHGLRIDPDQLHDNAEALIDQLAYMGLAKRLADGITYVGDGNAA